MKKIRILSVHFDNYLNSWETSAFRGAVIEKVGRENILFNHHLDNKKYLFRYPLIQYKTIRKKPAILCLGEGVEEIHKLFNKSSWEINLNGRTLDLTIDQLNLNNLTLTVSDKNFNYRMANWLALNDRNYIKYRSLKSEIEKMQMLERILIGNILSFAKGVNWNIEKEIQVRIHTVQNKKVRYKNTHLIAFDADFSSNVFLPNHIGLGKGASRGHGMVLNKKQND